MFLVVLLGPVALALVVWAILVLLAGRSAPDRADFAPPDQPGFDRRDLRYWKLGFYRNPQDSALWVAKRNPSLGTTLNIGHLKGRLVAAGILLGVALLIWGPPLLALLLTVR